MFIIKQDRLPTYDDFMTRRELSEVSKVYNEI